MSNKELLAKYGYVQFQSVLPNDLRLRCITELLEDPSVRHGDYNDENFYWRSLLAEEFRTWFREFLASLDLDIFGESDLGAFNRPVGDRMYWHCDSDGGDPNYGRRVFCCVYLTPTTYGRGPLVVIPGSHIDKNYDTLRARVRKFRIETSDPNPLTCKSLEVDFPDLLEPLEGQCAVDVPAGTVLVADERIIHSVAINNGPGRRVMAMWWRWKPIVNPND